jgi:hypothetical protein
MASYEDKAPQALSSTSRRNDVPGNQSFQTLHSGKGALSRRASLDEDAICTNILLKTLLLSVRYLPITHGLPLRRASLAGRILAGPRWPPGAARSRDHDVPQIGRHTRGGRCARSPA